MAGTCSGSVEKAYDNQIRLAAQTVNFGSPVTFGYDADGFMTSAGDLTMSRDEQNGLLDGTTLGNVADRYERNGFEEVAEYAAAYSCNPLLHIEYERDQVGPHHAQDRERRGRSADRRIGKKVNGK